MKRVTLGEFRKMTQGLPDNTILCCQSDSEGNSISTCLDFFIDQVGRKESVNWDGKVYDFTTGDDIQGLDMDKDHEKTIIIFQPSL